MADFDKIIREHIPVDGVATAEAIAALSKAVRAAVGGEFVDKARYRDKLDEIESLKTERQNALDAAASAESWKTKYDALSEDFTAYKTAQAARESRAAKEAAYRSLLLDAGISDRRVDTVIKCSGAVIDALSLDESGKIVDAAALTDSVKSEWADFVVSTHSSGADVQNPPGNSGGKTITREEIMNISDRTARRAAIAEHMDLFSGGKNTMGD